MMVYLVGGGPGDPGLLTLRGKEVLEQADVVVYDALSGAALLDFANPAAELIYVGKVAGNHALPQNEINALLVRKAREGKKVVRLKGGDPYIFGRGGEEADELVANGIPFEEVPGISSTVAAPAYAGIPLTHRDFTSSVTIITGHVSVEKNAPPHNWEALAKSSSTLVFVMGMANLPDIVANLLAAGMDPQTPAGLIYRGTTPAQRSLACALCDLPRRAVEEKFSNPSVIVVGKVASLRERFNWFEQKPLLGRSVVVTRAREQASSLAQALGELGAEVIQCPSIRVEPLADYAVLDAAIAGLDRYDWVVFTSVNGVEHFWRRLAHAGKDSRALGPCKVASIGPATAEALAARGVVADLVPERFVAESVVEAMRERLGASIDGARILLARAAVARDVLPVELGRCGAQVDVAPAYATVPDTSHKDEVLERLRAGTLDCVTFASSSTVENFLQIVPADELNRHPETVLAAIGPVTAKTMREHGLTPTIEPAHYTIPHLVEAVQAHFAEKRSCR